MTRWRTAVTALFAEHDQVEVVHRDPRVGQRRADGGGVAGVRVDHHHLDPGPELPAVRAASQACTAALVRPSTCPNRA